MKYVFINDHREEFDIKIMSEVHNEIFTTGAEVTLRIFEKIELFFNQQRIHRLITKHRLLLLKNKC